MREEDPGRSTKRVSWGGDGGLEEVVEIGGDRWAAARMGPMGGARFIDINWYRAGRPGERWKRRM